MIIQKFKEALGKLSLNDAAFTFKSEGFSELGFGFRCGFLGMLHMEIIKERLEREYGLDLIITAPSVSYKVILKGNQEKFIHSPQEFPRCRGNNRDSGAVGENRSIFSDSVS